MTQGKMPSWWSPPWSSTLDDPDASWSAPAAENPESAVSWHVGDADVALDDESILAPLEAEFGQVRSRERVRDLAEVFTHQREVDAMLDAVSDAFAVLDVKFLEPSCGSGNFLVEILRRQENTKSLLIYAGFAFSDRPDEIAYAASAARSVAGAYVHTSTVPRIAAPSAAALIRSGRMRVAATPARSFAPPAAARRASALLDALGFDPLGLDALQARTGLDTASLQVLLLELELEGEVARLPGGLFQRLVRA